MNYILQGIDEKYKILGNRGEFTLKEINIHKYVERIKVLCPLNFEILV